MGLSSSDTFLRRPMMLLGLIGLHDGMGAFVHMEKEKQGTQASSIFTNPSQNLER